MALLERTMGEKMPARGLGRCFLWPKAAFSWLRRQASSPTPLPEEGFAADRRFPGEEPILQSLLAHFADEAVDEVLINSTGALMVVSRTETLALCSPFDEVGAFCDWLIDFARIHETRLDPRCPVAGGRLRALEGRWHAVLPPLAADGPLLSLRRHRFAKLALDDFACPAPLRRQLARLVREGYPLLIGGPTGAGKTSLLVCLLRELVPHERVVCVETTCELPQADPAWLRLVASAERLDGKGGVDCEQLVAEALRLRPDRLVVGEIRGREARAWLAACATGHRGSMATIHAGSTAEALARVRALAGRAATHLPLEVAVAQMERGSPPRLASVELCQVSF